MVTNKEAVALYAAAAIWADGFYDETEKEILTEVAGIIETNEAEFTDLVESKMDKLKSISEDELNSKLVEAAKDLSEKDKGIIYEIVLEIMLADGKLAKEEVANLMAMADCLGMDETEAVLLLADMVKGEEELEVVY